jgi:hypothetical protein
MRAAASLLVLVALIFSGVALGQTTQPTTRPAAAPVAAPLPADQMLSQMLRAPLGGAGGGATGGAKPLQPANYAPLTDATTGANAVAPAAPSLTVLREGTFLVDRTGRLTRGPDGQSWEFAFDSDARAMQDPPVVILPNLKLMAMEQAVKSANRDLRFRITGMVTEYSGRNYVLLEKVLVLPEATQQF